jgi:hypothetical protein
LSVLAINDQGMEVVHEQVDLIAGQCWMGLGFHSQQRFRIDA